MGHRIVCDVTRLWQQAGQQGLLVGRRDKTATSIVLTGGTTWTCRRRRWTRQNYNINITTTTAATRTRCSVDGTKLQHQPFYYKFLCKLDGQGFKMRKTMSNISKCGNSLHLTISLLTPSLNILFHLYHILIRHNCSMNPTAGFSFTSTP